MRTPSVSKISSAVAGPEVSGMSWLPTTRNTGMPALASLAIRAANSRWCVWLGLRLL